MFTCYAIDDDHSSLETLKDYIGLKPNLSLLKTFDNPITALDFIKNNVAVDIIFLDIEMPEMNGVELTKLIRHKTKKVVFVTAHTKYAYDALELETDGYLLKPFSFSKFNNVVEKVLHALTLEEKGKPKIESFLIKQVGERHIKHKILFKDVLFFESQLRYTKIKTINQNIIGDLSFSMVKGLLSNEMRFIQVHRSYIISTDFIKIVGSNNIILADNTKVPIGRNYKSHFLKSVNKN